MAMTIEERIVDIKTRIAAMKAKLSIEENLTKPKPSVNIQENVPIEHRNSQRNKVIDYKSAYNEKTKKLVAKQYEIDIDTFKYTF